MKKKLATAEGVARWVHVDVADGVFTPSRSWNDPHAWKIWKPRVHTEVHIMSVDPLPVMREWLKAGVHRIIVHIESFERHGAKTAAEIIEMAGKECKKAGVHFMLAVNPETPVTRLLPHRWVTTQFQILAVHPGPAGQSMLEHMEEKVHALRTALPSATIEVDGGVTLETARRVKKAGASIVIAGSYVLSNADPRAAYTALKNV